jgi:mRNA interferase RelE/StbE
MRYVVILSRSVQKQLAKLSTETASRIEQELLRLQDNPRHTGTKKLKGREAWRSRVGDYRVIYEIHDKVLHVLVVQIGHRRDVYRDS